MRSIIRDVRVLSCDPSNRELERANILIEGCEIAAIGPDARFAQVEGEPAAQVIDGAGMLAIPGLINGHFHSPANLMKGALPGLPLEIFMLYEVPPLEARPPAPRTVYVRTMIGAIEMLKRGITAVQDDAFFVPAPDPASIDALMQAYADAGMRATVALDQPNVIEYEKFPFLADLLPEAIRREMASAPMPCAEALLDLYHGLVERWHGACDGRLRAAVSCSAPHRVTVDYLEALSALGRAHDLPFFMHILETKLQRVLGEVKYGRSLVRYVHERGLLDHRVNVIHGIWIDETDMDLIADAEATIAHNPVCNLRLGSGIMPFRRIRERGINVCIGTDEMLADDGVSVWAATKMAGLVHTVTEPDYRRWPQADELLQCLFHGGARAMGLEDRIGRLAPGFAADIVLLDLDALAFTPLNDLSRQLVYCEDGSSVRMTMVAGRVVVEDGRVVGCDESALKREAREIATAERPRMEAAAKAARELEPYYRQMYLRAAGTDVGMNRWAPPTPGE